MYFFVLLVVLLPTRQELEKYQLSRKTLLHGIGGVSYQSESIQRKLTGRRLRSYCI